MISVIDIGTNTILMLTAEIVSPGVLRVVDDHHEIARLGRGVDASRVILPVAFDRL
ncbi:MAG: Ppx/GppA family phosphatase, partial [bacterium]|nr:Ppx/GppA family phosphatase [Candidatus Kapabacteria bacterium]